MNMANHLKVNTFKHKILNRIQHIKSEIQEFIEPLTMAREEVFIGREIG